MQINVTFRHTEPSQAVREYAEEKLSKVKKYLEEPIEAHVVLKVEKFRHIAEVMVESNGLRLNGTEETQDLYSAIDLVADNIERQITRSKEKGRRRQPTAAEAGLARPAEAASAEEEPERRIVKAQQVYAKPMDLDEAVLQMDHSNGDFIVFTNRTNNRISVLYRRRDGDFGLIEPVQ